ncbi:MAG: hypothetical protein OEZ59_14185 [Deltaproteobacteria bacterium]|nr:hypothetical protein [Deltaproteobacteria bacterium]
MNFRKYILFVSVFAMAAGFSGGNAQAQNVKVTGDVKTGAGYMTWQMATPTGTESMSTPQMLGDASIGLEATKGAFELSTKVSVEENPDQMGNPNLAGAPEKHLMHWNHEVRWNIDKAKALEVSGNAFGIDAIKGNVAVINAPKGPVGGLEANLDFRGQGLANFEMDMGNMTVGAGLSDGCVPECGYRRLDLATGELVTATDFSQTLVGHIKGKADKINYNAYYTTSKGTFTGTKEIGKGTGIGAGGNMDMGNMKLGADYTSATLVCQDSLFECADPIKLTGMGLSMKMKNGFGGHIVKHSLAGALKAEVTNIDVVYLKENGGVSYGPEYRQTAYSQGGSSATDSIILFGMSAGF